MCDAAGHKRAMQATPGQRRLCTPLLVRAVHVRHSWLEAGHLSDQSIESSTRVNRERKT